MTDSSVILFGFFLLSGRTAINSYPFVLSNKYNLKPNIYLTPLLRKPDPWFVVRICLVQQKLTEDVIIC